MDQYAVMGNPIAHSKSPQIHQLFAQQTGQQLNYEKMLVPTDAFVETVRRFFADGGKGLNVTVPFKLEAWEMATVLSKRAKKAGSVNTLLMGKDDKLYGDNTDGVGLVRDITQNHGCEIEGKRLLVLGAGGAVRGVLGPLLKERPKQLLIANRTLSKAEELARLFGDEGAVKACNFEALEGQTFDAIINGTAASLQGEMVPVPEGVIDTSSWCYDMMYGAEETPFNRWARGQGVTRTIDGLGMLVEQAAEAFFLWRGVRPEAEVVIERVRTELTT